MTIVINFRLGSIMNISYREVNQLWSWSTFRHLFFCALHKVRFYFTVLIAAFAFLLPCFAFSQTIHPDIDLVLIEKAKRKMYLISNGETYREFYISLGENPVGHKQERGDDKTPEGRYTIDYRNPYSRFHLSLHITYPSESDIERANQDGVDPGGEIFIHGVPNGKKKAAFQYTDWTNGCIGVTNSEMKEIWKLVKNGTAIEIRP